MLRKIVTFLKREDGPTAVEYAVLLAMIVIVCIGAVQGMALATANSFDTSAQQISAAFGS